MEARAVERVRWRVTAGLLSASAVVGSAIGGTFGAIRALSLLPGGLARDREGLASLHRRLLALEAPVRRATRLAAGAALMAVVGWAL